MKKCTLIIMINVLILNLTYAGSLRVTANPCARAYSCMITDSTNARIILFGGGDYRLPWGQLRNDVWSLNLYNETWKLIIPQGPLPAPRVWACAVYDPTEERMILFGGGDPVYMQYYNDVWTLDLAIGSETWNQLTTSGTPPSPRSSAAGVLDPVSNRLVIFGGESGSGGYNTTWSLDLTTLTWSQLFPSGSPPSPRFEHSAIYDPNGHRMLVFGGRDGGHHNDLWALDLNYGNEIWQQISPGGSQPNQRGRHFCVYDSYNNSMVIGFGYSFAPFVYFNDVWKLDLGTLTWHQIFPVGVSVEGRRGSCAAYDPINGKIFIFGGDQYYDYYFSDTYVLTIDSLAIEENSNKPLSIGPNIKIYSNPTRPPCRINVFVPFPGDIRLKIFDALGRHVVEFLQDAKGSGNYIIQWDGKDSNGKQVPTGTYFVNLNIDGQSVAEKAILFK